MERALFARWRLRLNGASEYRWTNSPPRLSISSSNGAVLVPWPASAAGAALETTTDLAAMSSWSPTTNVVVNVNGGLGVMLTPNEPRQFHRLKMR